MNRCTCCNQSTRPTDPMCPDCTYAGCTRLLAQPTPADPHLMNTTGLNTTQRRARHRWHQQQHAAWAHRTEPTARHHLEHHHHQMTRFAYTRSTR